MQPTLASARSSSSHPSSAYETGSIGIIATTSGDPCLTSYALPLNEPPASIGDLALEAAAGLARLATSVALRWGVGRAALSGLGWTDRTQASANTRATITPAMWEPLRREWDESEEWHLPFLASVSNAAGGRPPAAQDAEPRCELTDRPRSIRQLLPHSSGRISLSADYQGRVMLLDGADLAVLRLWKGYRDATLGWLRSSAKGSELIIIFAPRRNQIDVWDATAPDKLCSLKTRRREGDSVTGAHMIYIPGSGRCIILTKSRRIALEGDAMASSTAIIKAEAASAVAVTSEVNFDYRGTRLTLRLQPLSTFDSEGIAIAELELSLPDYQ